MGAATEGMAPLRVNIQAMGRFTAYHAARASQRRGVLNRLISGRRRRDEQGIPFQRRRHIAWPAYLFFALSRPPLLANRALASRIADASFDRAAARHAEPVDIFHGFLAYSLHSMREYRRLGARVLVDTGAAHIRYENDLLVQEFARFGVSRQPMNPAWIHKQEREYEEADAIIVPSTFVRDTLSERGIPDTKIDVLPLGVDVDRFPYRPAERHRGPLRVISVGALSFEKGTPYLLEACEQLGPHVSLTLVGRSFPEMRSILRRSRLSFRHLPHVPNIELGAILGAHDVFVLASLQDGSGMVVTEAMSTGRVAIVTDHVGARDFIVDGAGFVVAPASATALAEALMDTISRRAGLPEMGLAAHEAVKDLTWEKYGEALMEIYQRRVCNADLTPSGAGSSG